MNILCLLVTFVLVSSQTEKEYFASIENENRQTVRTAVTLGSGYFVQFISLLNYTRNTIEDIKQHREFLVNTIDNCAWMFSVACNASKIVNTAIDNAIGITLGEEARVRSLRAIQEAELNTFTKRKLELHAEILFAQSNVDRLRSTYDNAKRQYDNAKRQYETKKNDMNKCWLLAAFPPHVTSGICRGFSDWSHRKEIKELQSLMVRAETELEEQLASQKNITDDYSQVSSDVVAISANHTALSRAIDDLKGKYAVAANETGKLRELDRSLRKGHSRTDVLLSGMKELVSSLTEILPLVCEVVKHFVGPQSTPWRRLANFKDQDITSIIRTNENDGNLDHYYTDSPIPEAEEMVETVACQCNNHSPNGCDTNGLCLTCEDNTDGLKCHRCKSGWYGTATNGSPYDCSPCPCPGKSLCYLDAYSMLTCLSCPPGFGGRLCDETE
uniref:Laminin EGF-like domain-containing protein n=1 Tax=Plectus sambesii TaxID=2011161 RepID=A0A914X1D2_9BILA